VGRAKKHAIDWAKLKPSSTRRDSVLGKIVRVAVHEIAQILKRHDTPFLSARAGRLVGSIRSPCLFSVDERSLPQADAVEKGGPTMVLDLTRRYPVHGCNESRQCK
jgi:hypothetical protein